MAFRKNVRIVPICGFVGFLSFCHPRACPGDPSVLLAWGRDKCAVVENAHLRYF